MDGEEMRDSRSSPQASRVTVSHRTHFQWRSLVCVLHEPTSKNYKSSLFLCASSMVRTHKSGRHACTHRHMYTVNPASCSLVSQTCCDESLKRLDLQPKYTCVVCMGEGYNTFCSSETNWTHNGTHSAPQWQEQSVSIPVSLSSSQDRSSELTSARLGVGLKSSESESGSAFWPLASLQREKAANAGTGGGGGVNRQTGLYYSSE